MYNLPLSFIWGEDKHENEELLRWAFPEDVWFHVDDMPSAHVYLRPSRGMSINDIPHEAIMECAQLVKANSIQGSKTPKVTVVYTPFTNLKKTGSMDVGQVGYHDPKQVRSVTVEKDTEILKRLNKTKEERKPDLREEREERDRQERLEKKRKQQEEKLREKEETETKRKEEEIRSYSSIMKEDNMATNKFDETVDYKAIEDDFM